MKLIVDGLDLADAVATVSRAANAKAINPVLEGIKLVAKDGKLMLCATDLEMYMTKTIRADVKKDGVVVVPGKLFSEYVRKLDKAQVSITADAASVVITHGDNMCNFGCLLVSEYPDIVSLSNTPHFSIKAKALADFIAKTRFAAAEDDSRPVLKGVLCELEGSKLNGVALDGFRLSMVTKTVANSGGDLTIVVPARCLEEVRRIVGDAKDDVSVVIANKFFQVSVGTTVFAARLLDGEFIKYREIIPQNFESDVVVAKQDFEQAVERAGLLVRSDRINLVTLKATDKQLVISSNNEMGKINEKVAASLTGKDVEISFNAKYLFDVMRNVGDEYIKLSFNGGLQPATITPTKKGEYLFLVLPVRMNQG